MIPNLERAQARGREARGAKRYTLLIRAAKLVSKSGECLCIIRDVSETGVSASIFHPLPEDEAFTLELQNGDRHVVELMWQNADRAGFRFADKVRVSRMIECPSDFAKRPVRINLTAPAQIEALGTAHFATICDISQQGAKVSCDSHFALDQKVKLLAFGMRDVFAKVRWRRDGAVGLVFEETFQFSELARIVLHLQGKA